MKKNISKQYSSKEQLISLIKNFSSVNVLVVGDLMLDKYIWGNVDRISPEAPVQIVNVTNETYAPGGAANVAANIASLDGKVFMVGLVGKDESNKKLISLLNEKKINTEGILFDQNKPTTQKIRIIGNKHQLLRVDYEEKEYINSEDEKRILSYVQRKISEVNVIVISDYAKGLITNTLVKKLLELAKTRTVPVIVDPKPKHSEFYKDVTLITPNHKEACEMVGCDVKNSELESVAEKLSKQLNTTVLITRGEKGMLLCKDKKIINIPTKAKEVYDVTGAGDTVIGALALSLGLKASAEDSAILANYAAGITVGKVGTTTVSRAELTKTIEADNGN